MIIRKPYAFLIRNFRKIHIFLLLLSLYVVYKLVGTSSFINDFMRLGVYDLYANPISSHISIFLMMALIILIVGSGSLIVLLKYKNKPWKIYLIPFVEYIILFFVLSMIKSFFAGYADNVESTNLRLSRDLLFIFMFGMLPTVGIFVMRVFGLDTKKFNFNSDQEFLELSEADREEVEINLNIDINSFKRLFRRIIRNTKYFYQEHELICKGLICIFAVVTVFNMYKLFKNNRVYKEGQLYNANGYTITVKDAFYTDKDLNGNVISKKSDFVIVRLSVRNNSSPRQLNTSYFHLKNRTSDYITTSREYERDFSDIGNCYDTVKELKRNESLDFIIIYRVKKKSNINSFALFYQEVGSSTNLRKIKLKVKDIRKIEDAGKFILEDDLVIDNYMVNDTISFDDYEWLTTVNYRAKQCSIKNCSLYETNYTAKEGFKVLRISFCSINFESKNMIDFFDMYGKIEYKDSRGETKEYDVKTVIDNYYGKNIYLLLPDYIVEAENLNLVFTVRNKKYTYVII